MVHGCCVFKYLESRCINLICRLATWINRTGKLVRPATARVLPLPLDWLISSKGEESRPSEPHANWTQRRAVIWPGVRLITFPSPGDPPPCSPSPYYDTISFFPELENGNPTINHVLPSPDISLAFLSVRNLINIRDFKFLIIKIANLIKIAAWLLSACKTLLFLYGYVFQFFSLI